MTENCKVSIIMPSLNVVKYIDECIQSALNQTLCEKEIICIDAGSIDGTWEKLLSYANNAKYKGLITLIQSDIKSYGYQINLGINQAVGEYIAILETDDYVEREMYEYLYEIAKSNDVDYAKADYDAFITYSKNKRFFENAILFRKERERYNGVLDPSRDMYLYTHDQTIWNGIYKKDFLLSYDIRLNESQGAAFQDIGFIQQVLACARRGIYTDNSFYRYRMDREQSSINSKYGLAYAYGEFLALLENSKLRQKIIFLDGFFAFMVQTFCAELIKSLRMVEYQTDSEIIKPYYMWFKKQIIDIVDKNLLNINLFEQYPQLYEILNNIKKFSMKLKKNDLAVDINRRRLLDISRGKKIVLFGIGLYGKQIIKYLYSHDIYILAVCDNNEELWNKEVSGLQVYCPLKCIRKFPNSMYVIANKKHYKEIYKQLIYLGIKERDIFICL